MWFWIFYLIAAWIAYVFFCNWLAEQKNQHWGWTIAALFLGFLVTLVLVGAPVRNEN